MDGPGRLAQRVIAGARLIVGAGVFGVLATLLYLAAPAAAMVPLSSGGTCSSTWSGPANGNWTVASNWTPVGVPGSGADVCINSGSPELGVSGGPSETIGTLTIGSGAALDLNEIYGSGNTTLTVTGQSTVSSGGSVTFTCSSNCGGGSDILAAEGSLINSGTITTAESGGVQADLEGDITNTGTLQINDATAHFQVAGGATSATLDNQGSIRIADGARLNTTQMITNDIAGSISATGTGTGQIVSSGTFNEAGTTTSSSTFPVRLTSGATLDYTGTGASSIEMFHGGRVHARRQPRLPAGPGHHGCVRDRGQHRQRGRQLHQRGCYHPVLPEQLRRRERHPPDQDGHADQHRDDRPHELGRQR